MNFSKETRTAFAVVAAGIALLFTAVSFFRPLMPVDETRYLSVAWEMMLQNHWILPTLNFEPYSHKPPLLFWLIRSLWEVLGVGIGPARIVSVAAMVGFLAAVYHFGRALTMNEQSGTRSMLLMAALPAWIVYGSVIMFDTLLGIWVVCAMMVLWRLAQGAHFKWWFVFGALMGLGILTKGPVALVYMLPPALLVKIWNLSIPSGWFKGLVMAVMTAALIGLMWAVPAAIAGGDAYAQKIFVTQSAGRMVNAFDHQEPFWFYGPVLIGFLAPLFFMPVLWHRAKDLKKTIKTHTSVRFILCWIAPVFLFFSAINSKSIHYMIPVLPGFAVLAAIMLMGTDIKRLWLWTVAAFVLVIGVHAYGARDLLPKYDLAPIAAAIEPYKNRPIAAAPKYDGEYGYVMRMQLPIESIGREDIKNWFGVYPDGIVILRHKNPTQVEGYNVLFTQPFRREEFLSIIEKKPVSLADVR